MRKTKTFLLACLIFPLTLLAQQNADQTNYFKAIFGVEKLTLVKDFIKVDSENNKEFWDTYAEYETSRKELQAERIDLITDYAENYTDLSDEKIEELCKRSIKQAKNNSKNIEKYFKKLKRIAGPRPAAQFLQIENYFLSVSKTAFSENIPFIGELDRVE